MEFQKKNDLNSINNFKLKYKKKEDLNVMYDFKLKYKNERNRNVIKIINKNNSFTVDFNPWLRQ